MFLCCLGGDSARCGQCFKPLRLGAVFLCVGQCASQAQPNVVSNPCASGRCSSVAAQALPRRRGARFKPLRLGAVFLWSNSEVVGQGIYAFQTPAPRGGVPLVVLPASFDVESFVSNPCASGRCSSVDMKAETADNGTVFQTPAPRGGVPLATRASDW